MKLTAALVAGLVACVPLAGAQAATLTAEELRLGLSQIGVNPGAIRNGHVLRSVRVRQGRGRGNFIVELHIDEVQSSSR